VNLSGGRRGQPEQEVLLDALEQEVLLEQRRHGGVARRSDSRTTQLYDRRQRRVTRNIVERISVTFDEPRG
jgi:hypothetical protein